MTPLLRDIGVQVEIFNALAASLVLGVMLIPTIASLSEDAMAAVPRDLRDGGYALGADKLQVSTRIVVPAAISGIIAAFVLGFSRAVGETMIVLIAAGQLAQITFDPRETIETMTAFIGATGNGDIPTGSIEYKTIFAVGLTLFVMTLVDEPALDQARAQVPRGLRVTVIEPHVERDFDPAPEQFGRRGQAWKNRLFKAAMLFSMFVAFGTLAVLLVDTIVTGWPAISWNLFSNPPSTVPAEAGARPAILATLYLGLLVLLLSVPIGVLTAIYLEEYADRTRWWNRLIEVNIQNLAAVPSIVYGILGLAFIVRGYRRRPRRLRRRAHSHARRPADGRRRLARGDPRGPGLDPPRGIRARCDEVAGRVASGAAGVDPGHGDRVDSRSLPRGGRDRSAHHGRRDHVRRVQPRAVRRLYGAPGADLQLDETARSGVPDACRGRGDRAARDRPQHERRGDLPSQPLPTTVVMVRQ